MADSCEGILMLGKRKIEVLRRKKTKSLSKEVNKYKCFVWIEKTVFDRVFLTSKSRIYRAVARGVASGAAAPNGVGRGSQI